VRWFIQSSAEDDILRQFEWYAEKGLPDIAMRFRSAVREAIDTLVAMPAAGAPRHLTNPELAGLRTWPVKGFDEFRVYYLARGDVVAVIRILHDKRDTDAILRRQKLEDPNMH
jgi:plasmid stabilization system protein ParE